MIDEARVRRPRLGALWILMAFALLASACAGDGSAEESGSTARSEYCEISADQREQQEVADTATPEELEASFLRSRSALDDAIAVAPDEIRADLELSAAGLDELIDALVESDWDFRTVSPAALFSDELRAAADRLDAYDAEFCGIGDESSSPRPAGADAAGPLGQSPEEFAELMATDDGRRQLIDSLTADQALSGEEATCIVDNLSADVLFALVFVDADPSPDQIDELFAIFERCGVSPEQFG